MVVLILERVPGPLRGELSRWMIEPHPGTFVGTVSALVRQKLWEMVCKKLKDGGAICVYTTNNEQGFDVLTFGETRREIVDFDGLRLVAIPQ